VPLLIIKNRHNNVLNQEVVQAEQMLQATLVKEAHRLMIRQILNQKINRRRMAIIHMLVMEVRSIEEWERKEEWRENILDCLFSVFLFLVRLFIFEIGLFGRERK